MWTRANRGRMADIEKKTKRYPTDLTDEEWDRITPFLPKPAKRGRKPNVDLREVLNAIRYIARTGCSWRMLPKDFPPWQITYGFPGTPPSAIVRSAQSSSGECRLELVGSAGHPSDYDSAPSASGHGPWRIYDAWTFLT